MTAPTLPRYKPTLPVGTVFAFADPDTSYASSMPLTHAVLVLRPFRVAGALYESRWFVMRTSKISRSAYEFCRRLRNKGKDVHVVTMVKA